MFYPSIMSEQTKSFRFASAKLSGTVTSQTRYTKDEMADADGQSSSMAASTTGKSTNVEKNQVRLFYQSGTWTYIWLEYDKENIAMFCKLCLRVSKTNA